MRSFLWVHVLPLSRYVPSGTVPLSVLVPGTTGTCTYRYHDRIRIRNDVASGPVGMILKMQLIILILCMHLITWLDMFYGLLTEQKCKKLFWRPSLIRIRIRVDLH